VELDSIKMETNFSNWRSDNWSASRNKLPTEEIFEDFFSCIKLISIPSNKSIFGRSREFDYEETSNRYRREFFPVIGTNQEDWITSVFKKLPNLAPLSSNDTGKYLLNEEKYLGDIDLVDHQLRKISPLALSSGSEIINILTCADQQNFVSDTRAIKKCKDLHTLESDFTYQQSHFRQIESNAFRKALKEKHYVQKLNHMEIIAKIAKLNEFFPNSPIYIMGGKNILSYLATHAQKPGSFHNNTYFIQDEVGYGQNEIFNDYSTAIFTIEEMQGEHKFDLTYKTQRSHRCWNLFYALVFSLGMSIPEDPVESTTRDIKDIESTKRWDMII